MPNRCPCDDCSGVENCPLKAVRVAVEAIREAAKEAKESTDGIYGIQDDMFDNLDGAIQAAFDAKEE